MHSGNAEKCSIFESKLFFLSLHYNYTITIPLLNFPGGTSRKQPNRQFKRDGFDPWAGKIPGRRALQKLLQNSAWRIPWTEEPGGLQSIPSHRSRHP